MVIKMKIPRNAPLLIVLGLSFVLGSLISDYAYNGYIYDERINEKGLYSQLGADPHMEYGGYSIERLAEGYSPASSNLFGKYIIDVPVISQYPELPVGCEITSAAALLNYLGHEIDKTSLASSYLKSDSDFFDDAEGVTHGPDPYKYFAGDPFGWGFGCFAPVITDALNLYFQRNGIDSEALTITGINSADMEKLVTEGVPVIVWASQDMKPFNYRDPPSWQIHGTDDTYTWIGNSHTLVLCGYDSESFYFMDCNGKTEITPYYKSVFLSRFEEAGSQAVVVKRQDSEIK